MAEVARSRKDRLRLLETQIRKNYEAFVQTGFALKEIRDDELYKEDGFETWDSYLDDRVGEQFGIERSQAYKLIACAQIRPKLPDPPNIHRGGHDGANGDPQWSQKTILEFGRLAPKDETRPGTPLDLDRLNKRDVERVAKKVIQHCEEVGEKPTSTVVRKFVDQELGVDRAAQAEETRRQRQEAAKPELTQFLRDLTGRIEAETAKLASIPVEVWRQYGEDNPLVVRRLTAACLALTALLKGESK